MEKETLFNHVVQSIIKLNMSIAVMKAADEWVENGKKEDDAKMIEIKVKLPVIMIRAMQLAIEVMTDESIKKLCSAAVMYHCEKFKIESPKDYMVPRIPKTLDPEKTITKFVNTHITREFLEKLPEEILNNNKYLETCDMIGATLIRLAEIDTEENGDGSRDQTRH
jgi:hypothetical protein